MKQRIMDLDTTGSPVGSHASKGVVGLSEEEIAIRALLVRMWREVEVTWALLRGGSGRVDN